jgi:hypothetical protein
MQPTPQQTVRAHQYLYYVLTQPVLSDWDYDTLCRHHGIEGGGGSSFESDYTEEEKALARRLTDSPLYLNPLIVSLKNQ